VRPAPIPIPSRGHRRRETGGKPKHCGCSNTARAFRLASFPALLRIDLQTFLSRSVQFFSPAIHSLNGLSKG
jgi:hypothetical protein